MSPVFPSLYLSPAVASLQLQAFSVVDCRCFALLLHLLVGTVCRAGHAPLTVMGDAHVVHLPWTTCQQVVNATTSNEHWVQSGLTRIQLCVAMHSRVQT